MATTQALHDLRKVHWKIYFLMTKNLSKGWLSHNVSKIPEIAEYLKYDCNNLLWKKTEGQSKQIVS